MQRLKIWPKLANTSISELSELECVYVHILEVMCHGCSVVVRMGVVCTPLRSKELDSVTSFSDHCPLYFHIIIISTNPGS